MKRLLELLFAPTSGEMLHVFVAWGALSLWFVIALLCVLKLQGISGQSHRYFFWILLPFTAGNLLSLLMLTQVDGNYFELLYVLWGVLGFCSIEPVKPGRLKKTAYGIGSRGYLLWRSDHRSHQLEPEWLSGLVSGKNDP